MHHTHCKIFDWFQQLPKECQRLFLDASLIADKKEPMYGQWNHLLDTINLTPTCKGTQREFAQFFTPADVALYAAFNLLENYQMDKVFDPCVGHGSLLIGIAIVLATRYGLTDLGSCSKNTWNRN
jgi:hypothetical protein